MNYTHIKSGKAFTRAVRPVNVRNEVLGGLVAIVLCGALYWALGAL